VKQLKERAARHHRSLQGELHLAQLLAADLVTLDDKLARVWSRLQGSQRAARGSRIPAPALQRAQEDRSWLRG
jgi:hypothetical protein